MICNMYLTRHVIIPDYMTLKQKQLNRDTYYFNVLGYGMYSENLKTLLYMCIPDDL